MYADSSQPCTQCKCSLTFCMTNIAGSQVSKQPQKSPNGDMWIFLRLMGKTGHKLWLLLSLRAQTLRNLLPDKFLLAASLQIHHSWANGPQRWNSEVFQCYWWRLWDLAPLLRPPEESKSPFEENFQSIFLSFIGLG